MKNKGQKPDYLGVMPRSKIMSPDEWREQHGLLADGSLDPEIDSRQKPPSIFDLKQEPQEAAEEVELDFDQLEKEWMDQAVIRRKQEQAAMPPPGARIRDNVDEARVQLQRRQMLSKHWR